MKNKMNIIGYDYYLIHDSSMTTLWSAIKAIALFCIFAYFISSEISAYTVAYGI